MDPVTHLVTGVLGERMSGPWFTGDSEAKSPKGLLPFCIIASLLPDVDNFFGNGDPEKYLLLHRGLTHSLLGGILMGIALALVFKLIFRKLSFLKLAATGCALVMVHLFLDYITSYGTQLLAPFSDARLSLSSVYIIDPFFTLVLAGAAVFAYLLPSKRVVYAGMGLFWLIGYPLTNLTMKSHLESLYAAKLHAENSTYEAVHFEPDIFTPLYWKVIVEQPDSWTLTEVKLYSPDKFEKRVLPKADPALLERLGESASMFRTWDWFSVYPWQTEQPAGTGKAVTFGDLRFMSVHPAMQAVFGNRTAPFTLTARLSPDGTLEGYTWSNGGSPKAYGASGAAEE